VGWLGVSETIAAEVSIANLSESHREDLLDATDAETLSEAIVVGLEAAAHLDNGGAGELAAAYRDGRDP
jgi:anti-anti-sigma regulatory factor